MLIRLTTGVALLATMGLVSCSGEHHDPGRDPTPPEPKAESPAMTRRAWAEKTFEAAKRKGLPPDGLPPKTYLSSKLPLKLRWSN